MGLREKVTFDKNKIKKIAISLHLNEKYLN